MTRYASLILILAACEPGPERPTYGTISPFVRQGEPEMRWPGDRSPTASQAQRAAAEAARRQLPRQPDSIAELNEELKEEIKREVVRRSVRRLQEQGAPVHCVYPSAVLGPDDPGLSESMHALRTFCRDVVLLTSSGFQPVDVRDLAQVIARLVERPGPGRWVASSRFLAWRDVADAIDSVTGGRVRRIPVPGTLVRLGGYVCDAVKHVWDFDFPMTVEGMKFATQWAGADGSHTEAALGVRFRDPAGTIAEALRWMHRAGHIGPQHVGRLAEEEA